MDIEAIKVAALPACRRYGVRKLYVYGSIVRREATEASDVDLLVEFDEPDRNAASRFFGLLHQLEDALGCEVDLLTSSSLKNPYFKQQAMAERVPLYEGPDPRASA